MSTALQNGQQDASKASIAFDCGGYLETAMHLTPREFDKLLIHTMADVALRRKAKGLKLNHPESVAVLCAYVLERAREGKTVEEVMDGARHILTSDDVMEGVPDLVSMVQVEAVFTDGSRLVSLHSPIV